MDSVTIQKNLVPPRVWFTSRVAKCYEGMPEKIGPQRLTIFKAFCVRFPKYETFEGMASVKNMLDKCYVPQDNEEMLIDLETFCEEVKSDLLQAA